MKKLTSEVESRELPLHEETIGNRDNNYVLWRGNVSARLMVIGEAPGEEEAKSGFPFVGKSGNLFDRMIAEQCNLNSQEHCFITNCVFVRPPNNRDPTSQELLAYSEYVREMVFIVRPLLIICLGRISSTLVRCGVDVNRMFLSDNIVGQMATPVGMSSTMREEGHMTKVCIVDGRTDNEGSYVMRSDRRHLCRMVTMRHPSALLRINSETMQAREIKLWQARFYKAIDVMDNVGLEDQSRVCGEELDLSTVIKHPAPKDTYTAVRSLEHFRQLQKERMSEMLREYNPRNLSGEVELFAQHRDCIYNADTNLFHVYSTLQNGESMVALVEGFMFPFYVSTHPALWISDSSTEDVQSKLEGLRDEILYELTVVPYRYNEAGLRQYWMKSKRTPVKFLDEDKIEVNVKLVEDKRILTDGYQPKGRQMLRIEVSHHSLVQDVLSVLRAKIRYYEKSLEESKKRDIPVKELLYEDRLRVCNSSFTPEQMLSYDAGLRASHWWKFKSAHVQGNKGKFHTQLVVHSNVSQIECLDPEAKVPLENEEMTSSDHAPSVHCSMDIECGNPNNRFPDAFHDPVVCVSNAVQFKRPDTTYDTKNGYVPTQGYHDVSFCLGDCDSSNLGETQHIFCFESERLLLECYFVWLGDLGPDRVIGHNEKRFDWSYLVQRAYALGVEVQKLGCDSNKFFRVDQRKFKSRAFGERVITELRGFDGWTIADTLEIYLREKKEPSYRLDALSQKYIGCNKDDVPYSAIWGLFTSTPQDRRRLIDYCLRDARLCDQLVNKHAWDVNMTEFGRVNGAVSENDLYVRGQQAKVLSAIMHRNRLLGEPMLIDTPGWAEKNVKHDIKPCKKKKNQGQKQQQKTQADNPEFYDGLDLLDTVHLDVAEDALEEEVTEILQSQKYSKQTRLSYFGIKKEEGTAASFSGKTHSSVPISGDVISSEDLEIERALLEKEERKRKRSNPLDGMSERKRVAYDLNRLEKEAAIAAAGGDREVQYKGATVMPPIPGLHSDRPVICVDFASLYPSLMIWLNISPDTKCYESDLERFNLTPGVNCTKMPDVGFNSRTGQEEAVYFVSTDLWNGLLPTAEKDLLAARSVSKKLMAFYDSSRFNKETGQWEKNPNYDSVQYGNYNGRQAQIKVVCNSMYGAMGAAGQMGDKDCAAGVTGKGREAIELVRDILAERYNAKCVGGDTDSVFMQFPGWDEETLARGLAENQRQVVIDTVQQAEEFSGELEEFINSHFELPMRIEYEKSMYPMLIQAKKRYCGVIWEKGKKGHFFSKGMETVRRDSLPYTKKVMKEVFDMFLLVRKDEESSEEFQERIAAGVEKAIEHVKQKASKLLRGEVDLADLVMSLQLSKEVYASDNAPHLQVKKKMQERGEDPPKLGERIPFVYVIRENDLKSGRSVERKGYEMAEHPDYAIKNNLPINYAHYMEKKFVKPVVRIMKHVLRKLLITRLVSRQKSFSGFSVKRKREISIPTAKQIEEECVNFLFEPAAKRSKARRNTQTRYMNLSGRKVVLAPLNDKNSPMARFLNKGAGGCGSKEAATAANNLRSKHDTTSLSEALSKEQAEVDKNLKEFSRCLQTCRECVKQEVVICAARECPQYYPRIISEGKWQRSAKQLEEARAQLVDIEDLV